MALHHRIESASAVKRSSQPTRSTVAPSVSKLASHKACFSAKDRTSTKVQASSGAPTPSVASFSESLNNKLKYVVGKNSVATAKDAYQATAWAVREHLIDSFDKTHEHWKKEDPKFIYYLSAEFLMGRTLTNAVNNLGLKGPVADTLRELGYTTETVADEERNAGLGNGGLGRLAACFLDSMANLDLPGWGYGIRYRYGMFKQILNAKGQQVEVPDIWLTDGNPWEVRRPDIQYTISFGGKVETRIVNGKEETVWVPTEKVKAVAYDNPIPGSTATPTTGNLRLWDAVPFTEFDLQAFNAGDYDKALLERERAESISSVLYPNDSTPEGKELRLKQQFFFVSASIQDVLARFKATHGKNFALLPEKAVFQLNDTHPTIAVAELLRLLTDVEGLEWEEAWMITQKCLNYTNHTVMPEALEKWPVKVMAKMLPRHMQIIETINDGWRSFVRSKYSTKVPASEVEKKVEAMSIIHPNPWNKDEMLVNMAYLAVVGGTKVNGVAAIHSDIVKNDIFNDFYELFPSKFQNKTNGVTPRRWLAYCNPDLAALITETLGSDSWINETAKISELKKFANDQTLHKKWAAVKQKNKAKLAAVIKKLYGDDVNLNALFDIQIKRIHEYKRQHLNLLSVIWKYKQLKNMTPEERKKTTPRVVIIGGKAASAYDMAKRIITFVSSIGNVINHDPETNEYLRLYFLPDYNVSLAETIIPAAELSQHISTAGTEASGTSNMKFQMNGCLIIGTLDGANIEIAEEAGVENVFVFGVKADEINQLRKDRKNFKTDSRWNEIMADIEAGKFGDKDYFKPLVDAIHNMKVGNDWFLVANDFASYLKAQEDVDRVYQDKDEWNRRSILYTAGSGKFSSDRTIREYADDIWNVKPCRPVV
uniref:Alpha-1,4 glucan phosphorylase n=2 Tax=Polytomella parva TaxID=51329 RepID=A0A7S0V133_9CHLO|nr:starch phosphorylase (SP) [Polytomella parva]|mmetsp:Transcript_25034/g.45314  ORF Transcript_25034/g.45314 Transcript_25034/m.45314 type:complete len:880 (+) Transcript_25034:203-2842(+)|eukprot:CAMPEP_0175041748 /NCGR_PEP_ID=MMETSP0052_2-20121109/2117_1 /TAXON_ID=51329 ORGANISM="Polytomella parva, Strain SAG 63-3" /NCGR_SAMPLE_ID=MMETSP0052_2 /ASSEMBLY_ACC=CAM_ASM_000194 /LENGTH=879 /DNA_ID=CAMNT_0016304357 /DNA_START=187 /DNA_END=2826 /DNA_ORIENTATION=-